MTWIMLLPLAALLVLPMAADAAAQTGYGNSAFERNFGDVKFLDAYFGTPDSKLEVGPGDSNVPFTVVLANVGTQDITGIQGQLSLPFGFSPADGPGTLILANSGSNSDAGESFYLTFSVNVEKNAEIRQYHGTVKVDYSRLRESGIRTSFHDFVFKVTGDSVINVRASEPFLTSLKSNQITIEIANDGTAPISSVDIVATNTQTEIGSAALSTTNVENVIIVETNWDVGNIAPNSSRHLTATVYVPEHLRGETLRIPLLITYHDAHGEQRTLSKIVDFYIKGLIDLSIYDIRVIELSGSQMLIGEIINEGNEDALFGFVTLEGLEGSGIVPQTQFIDEIETDAPVPFNIPLEFEGEPGYGEHDVKITVRYKDNTRDEIFLEHEATITVSPLQHRERPDDALQFLLVPIAATAGIAALVIYKRSKSGN